MGDQGAVLVACPPSDFESRSIVSEGPYGESGPKGEAIMLWWAVVFFLIAVVAGIFGFGGIAEASADIAQILFFIFLVIFILSLIFGLMRRRPPP